MKLYFDEDSEQYRLVAALRSRGMDVLSSIEGGMSGRDDLSQLTFAAEEGRVLVSANARDFALLQREWVEKGRSHLAF